MIGYIFISFVIAIIPAALFTYFLYDTFSFYRSREEKEKAIDKARAEGRCCKAILIKEGARDAKTDKSICKYKYNFNGKAYYLRVSHLETPTSRYADHEIEVFFRKSPKKAKIYNSFGQMETEHKYVFLILWFVFSCAVLVFLLYKLKGVGQR